MLTLLLIALGISIAISIVNALISHFHDYNTGYESLAIGIVTFIVVSCLSLVFIFIGLFISEFINVTA